jgi:multisubunit Na+/H+ antiporter MnhB subunit
LRRFRRYNDGMDREIAKLVAEAKRAPFRVRKRTMQRISRVWSLLFVVIVSVTIALQWLWHRAPQ